MTIVDPMVRFNSRSAGTYFVIAVSARIIGGTRLEDTSLLESMEAPLATYAEGNGVEAFVTLIQAAQHATIGFCLSEQLAMTSHELDLRAERLGHTPLVAAIGKATIGPANDRFEAMLRLLVRA